MPFCVKVYLFEKQRSQKHFLSIQKILCHYLCNICDLLLGFESCATCESIPNGGRFCFEGWLLVI